MDYNILMKKNWVKNHEDDEHARVVLLNLPKNGCTPFSTHIQVWKKDENLPLFQGHYFSFLEDAIKDYKKREA